MIHIRQSEHNLEVTDEQLDFPHEVDVLRYLLDAGKPADVFGPGSTGGAAGAAIAAITALISTISSSLAAASVALVVSPTTGAGGL